jgi:hypothetical protein
MANTRNQNNQRESINNKDLTPTKNKTSDLKDSPRDEEKLRNEETTIDMPEVKDIPGQEHIRAPYIGEMADTTASSSDEEGEGILDELNQDEDDELIKMGTEADVTKADVEMLRSGDTYYPSKDEDQLVEASMDNVDFDGEPLNEKGFGITMRTAKDLDVPGAEEDDLSEEEGEEDEENNEYSLGGEDNEQNEERTT